MLPSDKTSECDNVKVIAIKVKVKVIFRKILKNTIFDFFSMPHINFEIF